MSTNEVNPEAAPVVAEAQPLPTFAGSPRNGQWTKFRLPAPDAAQLVAAGAHVSGDGFFVGVFVVGGIDSLGTPHPTRIEPVDGKGLQVRSLSPDRSSVLVAQLNPAGVLDLHPLTDRNDVPADRLATMSPEWIPQR